MPPTPDQNMSGRGDGSNRRGAFGRGVLTPMGTGPFAYTAVGRGRALSVPGPTSNAVLGSTRPDDTPLRFDTEMRPGNPYGRGRAGIDGSFVQPSALSGMQGAGSPLNPSMPALLRTPWAPGVGRAADGPSRTQTGYTAGRGAVPGSTQSSSSSAIYIPDASRSLELPTSSAVRSDPFDPRLRTSEPRVQGVSDTIASQASSRPSSSAQSSNPTRGLLTSAIPIQSLPRGPDDQGPRPYQASQTRPQASSSAPIPEAATTTRPAENKDGSIDKMRMNQLCSFLERTIPEEVVKELRPRLEGLIILPQHLPQQTQILLSEQLTTVCEATRTLAKICLSITNPDWTLATRLCDHFTKEEPLSRHLGTRLAQLVKTFIPPADEILRPEFALDLAERLYQANDAKGGRSVAVRGLTREQGKAGPSSSILLALVWWLYEHEGISHGIRLLKEHAGVLPADARTAEAVIDLADWLDARDARDVRANAIATVGVLHPNARKECTVTLPVARWYDGRALTARALEVLDSATSYPGPVEEDDFSPYLLSLDELDVLMEVSDMAIAIRKRERLPPRGRVVV